MKQRQRQRRLAEDLARAIHARLMRTDDLAIAEDPIGYLTRAALDLARLRDKPHLRVVSPDRPETAAATESLPLDRSIQAAVDILPRLQRDLLIRHINDGLTYRQIAQQMMLPNQMVLEELARAYSWLRVELDVLDIAVVER